MDKYLKIFFSVLRNIAVPVFGFLTMSIGIKFYGKGNWGELLNVLLWVYFYAFILNWGHRDYLLRSISKNPAALSGAFFTNFINRTLFLFPATLLLFLFYPFQTSVLAIILIFLIHINSSFESLVIYNQKFTLQLMAETIGFALFCFLLFLSENFSVSMLLGIFILVFAMKNVFLFIFIKIPLPKSKVSVSVQELIVMFPFFLIVFSGWIHSKIDLYIVSSLLPSESLSKYQLLNTSFLMLQAMAGFILMPMTKHMYRISKKTAGKIIYKLGLISIPIIITGTFCIWFLLNNVLDLQIEYYMFVIGGASTFPIFLYIINIINLYKNNHEIKVVKINFFGASLNLLFSLLLTYCYGYLGAFIAVLLTQYILLLVYKTRYPV